MLLPIAAVLILGAVSSVTGGPYDTVEAALGDVPYTAGIYRVVDYPIANVFKREFICTGAILDATHVLTTATCALSATYTGIAVAPGLLNRTDKDATFLNVTQTKAHKDFDFWTKDNDIAILEVTPGFTWSPSVAAVDTRKTAAPTGSSCRISGWRQDMVTVNAMLSYGNATTFDQSACFYLFGKTGFLCGGVPKEERCGCLLGDEGGPLVCDGLLTGLFHYNMNTCFDVPQPGVYTDLVYQKDWIAETLRQMEL